MGMVGEACLPSNAYSPRTPDYTFYSGVHVCWSEHSDSSFVYGFISLDFGLGTTTAATLKLAAVNTICLPWTDKMTAITKLKYSCNTKKTTKKKQKKKTTNNNKKKNNNKKNKTMVDKNTLVSGRCRLLKVGVDCWRLLSFVDCCCR